MPIERDPNISPLEKSKHMEDWWTKEFSLFSSLKLTESELSRLAAKSKICCRYGVQELLKQTRFNDIPFVVVSGGVKDVIDITFIELMKNYLGYPHRPFELAEYERLREFHNFIVLSNTFTYEMMVPPKKRKNAYDVEVEMQEIVEYPVRTTVDIVKPFIHSQNKYWFVNEFNKKNIGPYIRKNAIVIGD